MKKALLFLTCLVIAVTALCSFVFAGCGGGEEEVEKYTVILDYQGATVTGDRQITVKYGEALPQLPQNLQVKGKEFCGWFTAKECGGTQIADSYGNIPVVSVLNEANFDLSNEGKFVYIFAGFTDISYTVEFRSDNGSTLIKSVKAKEGSEFSQVGSGVFYNDQTVLAWSKEIGGAEFSGKISEDITVYALSYGYTVSYDANGATGVASVVVKKGVSVTPPVMVRTGYTFSGWYDATGKLYEEAFTPTKNTELTARWKANVYTVTFNPQSGTLNSTSQEIAFGSEFNPPVPTRTGYLFDGWFTKQEGGEQVTARNGSGISEWNKAMDTALYAQWVKLEYEVSLDRKNCKQDNGYNPDKCDTDDRAGRHDGFDVVKLLVKNAEKLENGTYRVPQGYSLGLSLKVLQNVSSLPLNGNAGSKEISDDGYSAAVTGTNISNKQIGRGAYYVSVNYTDGTKTERNATNILSGKSQGDTVQMNVSVDSNKSISSVSVVVVYEIYTRGQGFLGIWWEEHSNWRLTTTLNFS